MNLSKKFFRTLCSFYFKQFLLGFLALSTLIASGCSYSQLTIKVDTKENTLENIRLRYLTKDEFVTNADMPLLNDRSRLPILSDNSIIVLVDFERTNKQEHLRIYDEMQKGMKPYIVVLDSDNKEVARQLINLQGYRSTVSTVFDGQKRPLYSEGGAVTTETTIAYGNQSLIPVKVKLNRRLAGVEVFKLLLELNYDTYRDDPWDSSFDGEKLSKELRQSHPKEVEKRLLFNIKYRDKYKGNPRIIERSVIITGN